MHAASRDALGRAISQLEGMLGRSSKPVVDAAECGIELFDCVGVLDSDRALRVAVAEASTSGPQRAQLVRDVFEPHVSASTLSVLVQVASDVWSTPKELRTGLVELGRRSLLHAAKLEGQLERVEGELYQLSRILEREGRLTQLLIDRTATPRAKRSLLASVLYGKVSAITEALALQAVARPQEGPIEDIARLSELAAAIRGMKVARVTAAAPLTDEQQRTLSEQLGRIYGEKMVIHTEVDTSLLGGMVIRVGDEIIDGSTAGKLARLRAAMA
ncbi:F0F1 ATP synthase subunit delta [Corynebacterium choanae]|uniref:ATP synthase subunit delta n=1 Tax=Corynebacterium choanae TaxID=1862358 RepID=A0A3G6J5V5_9CORY|nr:F0F1 ATP synthase subunit delta [Corynebacterium choanae]AZA13326.1 ATP synthase subunit delta [Corynebacterium choanae]